jgi:hypothetical protein
LKASRPTPAGGFGQYAAAFPEMRAAPTESVFARQKKMLAAMTS